MMNETTNETDAAPAAGEGWDWAVVEIFGHRRHAGRIREEERFGSKMLRIDVPTLTPHPADVDSNRDVTPDFELSWTTHYYGGGSIFSLTMTDEDSVMRANRPYQLPYRARLAAPEPFDADGDIYDDDNPL